MGRSLRRLSTIEVGSGCFHVPRKSCLFWFLFVYVGFRRFRYVMGECVLLNQSFFLLWLVGNSMTLNSRKPRVVKGMSSTQRVPPLCVVVACDGMTHLRRVVSPANHDRPRF